MPERLYGIRHHGPGSARAVLRELDRRRPDVLLVEGPPEADDLIRWVEADGLEPPVALLGYATDDPRRAAFWPFAVFSPEWQAMRWAVANAVPVRFFDPPYAYRLAAPREPVPAGGPGPGDPAVDGPSPPVRPVDPIGELAAAAGIGRPVLIAAFRTPDRFS